MPRLLFPTRIGKCDIAWDGDAITSFSLPSGPSEAAIEEISAPEWVSEIIARVQQHMEGVSQDFTDVPLDWARVNAFQQNVYRETQAIKPGCTKSYGEIARALGLGPEGARAVGVALGSNPWPLLVPCHRVVSASGKMTGFSAPGGIHTKTRLLALEGAELLLE